MQTILALVLSKIQQNLPPVFLFRDPKRRYNIDLTVSVAQETDIPAKILLENKRFFAGFFQIFFNDVTESSKFPSSLKMANIKAFFKKGTKRLKEDYRPISILPLISRIFERIICKQLIFFLIFYQNISADLEKAMVYNTVYC